MNYRHLILDVDRARHVATVTLNKPERLNAIDQTDKVDLLDAIARIQDDDAIWVARGQGGIMSMVLDATNVYWSTDDCKIRKTPL